MDSRKRTIVKAILWNLIGLGMMVLVGFAMTGSAGLGGAMAVVNALIGLTCYVIYERAWARIGWGRGNG